MEVRKLSCNVEIAVEQNAAKLSKVNDAVGGHAVRVFELHAEGVEQNNQDGVEVGGIGDERPPRLARTAGGRSRPEDQNR